MRDTFHEELDQIGSAVVDMIDLAGTAVRQATTALLDADLTLAEAVIAGDTRLDALYRDVEDKAFDLLARQQPVAGDLRIVVTSLRMVADIERMGDLALHVAKVARMRYPGRAVPPELRDTMAEMGRIAQRIGAKVGAAVAGRDAHLARELESDDDAMDELLRDLFQVLLRGDWPHGLEAAIDSTLIGRYYERFADHAVSVARRVVYLVTGELPVHPAPDGTR